MRQRQFLHTRGRGKTAVFCAMTLVLALFLSACAGGQVKKTEPVYHLGVQITTLTPFLAQDLDLTESRKGLVVLAVYKGSPAAVAGIRRGDVILGIKTPDGNILETLERGVFPEQLNAVPADLPVELSVLREGETITLSSMRTTENLSGYVQPEARPEPRTIKVARDGSGDFRTINGAMFAARPGDTILLTPLPLNEIWQIHIFLDDLTLRSEDPANRTTFQQIILRGLKNVMLQELEFRGIAGGNWPGVLIVGCDGVTVENCSFSKYPRAIGISNSRGVSVTGNRMLENNAGISASSSDCTLSRNLIVGLPMEGATIKGIWVQNVNGTISNNTIAYHNISTVEFIKGIRYGGINGAGIHVGPGSNVSVENNIVYDNSAGIYLQGNARYRIEFNNIFQNTVPQGGTGPVGIFASTSFEDYLTGSDWNISKGTVHRFESAPVFSLSSWSHDYYAPNPIPLSRTNLSQDPFFNDPTRGDYRLAADSPLIGRGRVGTFIGAFPPVEQGAGEGEFK